MWLPGLTAIRALAAGRGLTVETCMASVREECTARGIEAPAGQSRLALFTVLQWNGSVLFEVARALGSGAALSLAWELHRERIEQTLAPLLTLAAYANGILRVVIGVGAVTSASGIVGSCLSGELSRSARGWIWLKITVFGLMALGSLAGWVFRRFIAQRAVIRLLTGL